MLHTHHRSGVLKCRRSHRRSTVFICLSPLQTGFQLLTLQSVVEALTDQSVDGFLKLLQQSRVCTGMNGLVKISQLLPETTGEEQTVARRQCSFLRIIFVLTQYVWKTFQHNIQLTLVTKVAYVSQRLKVPILQNVRFLCLYEAGRVAV